MNLQGRTKVALLMGDGLASRVVHARVAEKFDVVAAVLERPPSRGRMVERRVKRLGLPVVADQLLFQMVLVPLMARASAGRARRLQRELGLVAPPFPDSVVRVGSVNDEGVPNLLRQSAPDVVVVAGTRIIGRRVLGSVDAPFVNMHMGITPTFRGVHGGYWALAENRPELCGVTIHLVDPGIDTGGVLAQATISPGAADSYSTYPLLQLGTGLPLLMEAIPRIGRGDLTTVEPLSTDSRLYYHPGATQYLRTWWKRGTR